MKNINAIKRLLKEHKKDLEQQYNVKALGIFGSYAKGNSRKNSDIDILVEFSQTPDFFKFLRLERFLGELLGVKVDLVTRKALKPAIKKTIINEAIFV